MFRYTNSIYNRFIKNRKIANTNDQVNERIKANYEKALRRPSSSRHVTTANEQERTPVDDKMFNPMYKAVAKTDDGDDDDARGKDKPATSFSRLATTAKENQDMKSALFEEAKAEQERPEVPVAPAGEAATDDFHSKANLTRLIENVATEWPHFSEEYMPRLKKTKDIILIYIDDILEEFIKLPQPRSTRNEKSGYNGLDAIYIQYDTRNGQRQQFQININNKPYNTINNKPLEITS